MTILSRRLYDSGELRYRIDCGLDSMKHCTLCPRGCGADRLAGEIGFCGVGAEAHVSSYGPHFGEEDVLVGQHGSGTIFFTSCNLRCCFCQNHEISFSTGEGRVVSSEELAGIMLHLQEEGCHNINLVTPSHQVVAILAAIETALGRGLDIPLVYNCGGYEGEEALSLLDGVVDIYMPDFKFWHHESARKYCGAGDYPDVARRSVLEMYRQVGDLVVDKAGHGSRGLLVRHLLMPGCQEETQRILGFLADEVSPTTSVNIMDQYRPCAGSDRFEELGHGVAVDEFQQAKECADHLGLKRLDDKNLARLMHRLGLF